METESVDEQDSQDLIGRDNSEFTKSISSNDRKPKIELSEESITAIRIYLDNPTKSGLWSLQAKWNNGSAFSAYVIEKIAPRLEKISTVQVRDGKYIEISDETKKNIYSTIKNTLTFINYFFTDLVQIASHKRDFSYMPDIYNVILSLVDKKVCQKNFQASCDFFSSNIYYESFVPLIVWENMFCQIKDGYFIVTSPALENETVVLQSTDSKPLETYAEFLKLLGVISDCSIRPIFSPEESVFEPYFSLLKISYPYIIGDRHARPLFERAFNEFTSEAYTNCVGTIGLIAEDYFTQIYETFFRDVCPRGLTLGQVYDRIENSVAKMFSAEPKKFSDLSPMYSVLKNQIAQAEASPESTSNKELLVLLRSILNILKEDRAVFQEKLDQSTKQADRLTVFPKYLRDNSNELIRYRNAASHKTRIPIGSYEALRAVYCLISIYLWWESEKKTIDWKDDPKTILKKAIERNMNVTLK